MAEVIAQKRERENLLRKPEAIILCEFAIAILRINRMEDGGIITLKRVGSMITCYGIRVDGFGELRFKDNGQNIGDHSGLIDHITTKYSGLLECVE